MLRTSFGSAGLSRVGRARLHRCGERVIESLEARRLLATFFVTNVADAGAGSLRAAINNANATGIQDSIEFNFAAGGLHTIALASPLPTMLFPTTIDGTTANGFISAPLVELNGAGAGAGAIGLDVAANGCIFRALTINRFSSHGIRLTGNSSSVHLCYIGTNSAGLAAMPNGGAGVVIDGDGNVIGALIGLKDNVISGNNGNGVLITSGSNGNTVAVNYIGTDINGQNAIANLGNGVRVVGNGNTIGGLTGAGNTISGNGGAGVFIDSCSSNIVGANIIGSTAFTFTPLPNGGRGVYVLGGAGELVANNNTIGTGVVSSSNLIHDNGLAGVEIDTTAGGTATGNLIVRNSLSENGGLGIDLIGAVNGSQGAPVLTSVTRGISTIRITVSLSGAGFSPNQAYNIEIFQSTTSDPSGFGEGLSYLTAIPMTTDGAAVATAVLDVTSVLANLPLGRFISATCTNGATNSTSEFSASVELRDIEIFGTASADKWSVRNDNAQTTLRVYPSGDFTGTPYEFDKSLVDSLVFHGGGGDDDVYIDLGNGEVLPPGSTDFLFSGETGTADALHLQGSGTNEIISSTGTGAFTIGTSTFDYDTIEAAVLDGALGNDTFNIGNTNLTTYALTTTILGAGGTNDTLNISDSSGSAFEKYTFTSTSMINVNASDTLLFGGVIFDSALEHITLSAGGGISQVVILSTSASTTLAVQGNGGADFFTVGNGNLDSVAGAVSLTGNGGTDSITLDDHLNGINDSYTINALVVTRPRFGGLTIVNGESLTVTGGTSSNIFNVTHNSSATALSVDSGNGTDTVNVIEANGTQPVQLLANAGNDNVIVNSDLAGTAAALISGNSTVGGVNVNNGGTLTVATNGATLLTAKSLTIGASGKLELNDNDFAVTNTSWSAIEGYVRDAYNFGDWLGARGIFSSTAKNNPVGNTTLGVLNGQEFIDNNGGTFDGRTVISSDVLVKYTYFGDVDFSGSVDVGDYNLIDFGYVNHLTTWAYGDADHSGGVDASDYNVIDFAFATQSGVL